MKIIVGQKVNFTKESIQSIKDLINNPILSEAYGSKYLQERLKMKQSTHIVEALVPFTNLQTGIKTIRIKLIGEKILFTQDVLK